MLPMLTWGLLALGQASRAFWHCGRALAPLARSGGPPLGRGLDYTASERSLEPLSGLLLLPSLTLLAVSDTGRTLTSAYGIGVMAVAALLHPSRDHGRLCGPRCLPAGR